MRKRLFPYEDYRSHLHHRLLRNSSRGLHQRSHVLVPAAVIFLLFSGLSPLGAFPWQLKNDIHKEFVAMKENDPLTISTVYPLNVQFTVWLTHNVYLSVTKEEKHDVSLLENATFYLARSLFLSQGMERSVERSCLTRLRYTDHPNTWDLFVIYGHESAANLLKPPLIRFDVFIQRFYSSLDLVSLGHLICKTCRQVVAYKSHSTSSFSSYANSIVSNN